MSVPTKTLDEIKAQARLDGEKDAGEMIDKTGGGLEVKALADDDLDVKYFEPGHEPHNTLDGQKESEDFIEQMNSVPSGTTFKSQGYAVKGKDGKLGFAYKAPLAGDAGGTTGAGAVIPVAFEMAIFEQQELNQVVVPHCTVVPMATSQYKRPRNTGGTSVAWSSNDSVAAIASSEPTFDQFVLNVRSVRGLVEIARNADKDTSGLLSTFAARDLGRVLARAVDVAVLRGATATSFTGLKALTGRNGKVAAAAGTLVYKDLVTAWSKIGLPFRGGARWFGSGLDSQILMNLVDTNGRPLWIPVASSGIASPIPTSIFGKSYGESDQIPENLATVGPVLADTTELFVGDFSQYIIGNRQELEITVSDHVKFAEDLRVVKAIRRLAGNAISPTAFWAVTHIKQ